MARAFTNFPTLEGSTSMNNMLHGEFETFAGYMTYHQNQLEVRVSRLLLLPADLSSQNESRMRKFLHPPRKDDGSGAAAHLDGRPEGRRPFCGLPQGPRPLIRQSHQL